MLNGKSSAPVFPTEAGMGSAPNVAREHGHPGAAITLPQGLVAGRVYLIDTIVHLHGPRR